MRAWPTITLTIAATACVLAQSQAPVAPVGGTQSPPQTPATRDKARPARKDSLDVARRLDDRIPHVKFIQERLEDVLRWVQDQTGAIVATRWNILEDAGITRDTPISLEVKDKTLASILWAVINEAAIPGGDVLAYEATGERMLFSTDRDLGRELITRTYNIEDIPVDHPMFDARKGFADEGKTPRAKVERPGSVGSSDGQIPVGQNVIYHDDPKIQELMELVLNVIEPDSWEANARGGKGTLFPYKGRFVIRNSLKVHQLIGGIVNKRIAEVKAKPPPPAPKREVAK